MLSLQDAGYEELMEDIREIKHRNFTNTMLFLEEKLNIKRFPTNERDKAIHYVLRGAIIHHGRNLTNDIVARYKESLT